MSDIFLSYDSRDLQRIKPLAAALSAAGWTVFYDRTVPPGKTWRQVIGREMQACRCMVVAWSKYSIDSDWVLEEADEGLKLRILVPFLLDDVKPPLGFRAIQAADLVDWQGYGNVPGFLGLCAAVSELIPKPQSSIDKMDASFYQDVIRSPSKKEASGSGTPTFSALTPQPPSIVQPTPKATRRKFDAGLAVLVLLAGVGTPYLYHVSSRPQNGNSALPLVVSTHPEIRVENNQPAIKLAEMVNIPAGEFWMGLADDDKSDAADEKPRHKVSIKAFALGKYEVTKGQFAEFAAHSGHQGDGCRIWNGSEWTEDSSKSWRSPGFEQSDNDPVACVSHSDAIAYIRWLNVQTGRQFRLPTEAEWEYAARGGSTSDYFWGNADAKQYAWFSESSEFSGTLPVDDARIKANAFGLYHMAGNVWEWVQDCYAANYDEVPKDGSVWEIKDCTLRVLRGGSWGSASSALRSANRIWGNPGLRYNFIGFRLAQG